MQSIDELNNARKPTQKKLERRVFDRPKFSRRHDFQAKKIETKYAETRHSADVIGLKKHSNTDSDVNSQFTIKK